MNHRPDHPGFSLVELIVVIVILAVLSGMVVPRLLSSDERRGQAEAERVADLLSLTARRDALSSQPLAVDFTDGRLRVMAYRMKDSSSFEVGGEQWVEDALIPAVAMDSLELAGAAVDGVTVPARQFRVELKRAAGRPAIELTLADAARRHSWVVRLPDTTDRAQVLSGDEVATAVSSSIDLDQAGRRDDPW